MRTITAKAGEPSAYVGRFAPSPTGQLHLGTLTAAVASYLHARQAGGEWLVRIEDIDPPREVPGSADSILCALEALNLHWDGEIRYQSSRLPVYLEHAAALERDGAAFRCDCSRRQIRALTGGSAYPGTCRDRQLPPGDTALRLRVDDGPVSFDDGVQGTVVRDVRRLDGDFVIVRRDGLPAYHLAVVIDDADQGVSDIVRGADLIDSTPLHILLQRRLGLPTPRYWHIPVLTDSAGEKLSKGSGATAVDITRPEAAARAALEALGLTIPEPLTSAPAGELWQWAIGNWRIRDLAGGPDKIPIDG